MWPGDVLGGDGERNECIEIAPVGSRFPVPMGENGAQGQGRRGTRTTSQLLLLEPAEPENSKFGPDHPRSGSFEERGRAKPVEVGTGSTCGQRLWGEGGLPALVLYLHWVSESGLGGG